MRIRKLEWQDIHDKLQLVNRYDIDPIFHQKLSSQWSVPPFVSSRWSMKPCYGVNTTLLKPKLENLQLLYWFGAIELHSWVVVSLLEEISRSHRTDDAAQGVLHEPPSKEAGILLFTIQFARRPRHPLCPASVAASIQPFNNNFQQISRLAEYRYFVLCTKVSEIPKLVLDDVRQISETLWTGATIEKPRFWRS
jgi:hypothetical protein